MSALDEVRDLAEAVTRRKSLRLWDVELSGASGTSLVRVLVDADDGVDLDTVAEVSEELSRALDLHDPLPGRYTLEVSSPGIERNLKSPEHFSLSVGRRVVVKTRTPIVEGTHRIEGVLAAAEETSVRIAPDADAPVTVPYEAVKSARTVFEWSK